MCNEKRTSTEALFRTRDKNRKYTEEQLIHHSDRGVQYCSNLYQEVLSVNGGVRGFLLLHYLISRKKCLKILEAKVALEGYTLIESQLVVLEKVKVAHGEIEIHYPYYLVSQGTYLVGKVYAQTFIDTYCKIAHVKLYDRKEALVAADLLNEPVVPFYDKCEIPLMRILTDRGTEYCRLL